MTEEFTAGDAQERFIALTKLAKLKQRQANQRGYSDGHLELGAEAGTTRERAIGYTTECIAQETYKHEPAVFSREVQARFSAVGRIVDQHIQPGRQTLDQRRALIERAEEFASFSPYHEGHDESDHNQGIADRLNAAGAIFKYQLARELGTRRLRSPMDVGFTAQQARELTDELGHLHQEIRTRLRTIDHLFNANRTTGSPGLLRILSATSRLFPIIWKANPSIRRSRGSTLGPVRKKKGQNARSRTTLPCVIILAYRRNDSLKQTDVLTSPWRNVRLQCLPWKPAAV
ncbi:hypothetical protein AJ87_07545 [Rhizobium yanglingense]|nr:hypothetical protein AJ87_07545 [Rhizobium yanglingense]